MSLLGHTSVSGPRISLLLHMRGRYTSATQVAIKTYVLAGKTNTSLYNKTQNISTILTLKHKNDASAVLIKADRVKARKYKLQLLPAQRISACSASAHTHYMEMLINWDSPNECRRPETEVCTT